MKKAEHITNGNVNLTNITSGSDKPEQILINPDKIILSKQELDKLIETAFKAGENWGVTYSTWFVPTVADTKEKTDAAKAEAYKTLNIITNK
jgi:hypothetical protein